MRDALLIAGLAMVALAICVNGYAFDNDDEGRVKFSLSSLPLFDDSDKGSSASASTYNDDDYVPDKEKYTYNAMGQKVPVKTERSGIASPIN
jgi:hypothetical protein